MITSLPEAFSATEFEIVTRLQTCLSHGRCLHVSRDRAFDVVLKKVSPVIAPVDHFYMQLPVFAGKNPVGICCMKVIRALKLG